ncbi:DNA helicase PIF1, ATP-dependent [Tanacetum coccineum]
MYYEEREEKSKKAVNPTFSLCCQGGKVLLPTFNDTPPPLNSLLDYNYPATSKFRDQIRVYNSMFCFASFDAKIDHSINTGGRLFQQYLVDAYSAVEERRLKWTRNNQDTLWVDLYHYLCDAVTRGGTNAVRLGKRIVLPMTFTRSLRYMMQNYQDAMALCRAYGNPDFFITFTSNLKWPEIAEMLNYFPDQKAHDRPEVGTRVFKIKLTELLDDLTKKHVFEESYAAELPSPTDDPDGYKVVTDYMLHGPCRKDASYAACTTDGKCSKHLPKAFLPKTFLDEEGYPHYRRRDNKVTVKKGKFTYDNKHVVPHNRYMLLIYNAHINVEWCNRSKAIKYLFKYLNKGPDCHTPPRRKREA